MMKKYLKTKKLDFKTCAGFVPKLITLDLLSACATVYDVTVTRRRRRKILETKVNFLVP